MLILGLGSNIGNRQEYLAKAVASVKESIMTVISESAVYSSEAVLKQGAPTEWDKEFLNIALMGETHLSPEMVLRKIKMIERNIGRRQRGTWGPREIDIDILAYDDRNIMTPELTIPHKELLCRPFALMPLAELTPNWRYSGTDKNHGKTAYQLVSELFYQQTSCKKTDIVLPLLSISDYSKVA